MASFVTSSAISRRSSTFSFVERLTDARKLLQFPTGFSIGLVQAAIVELDDLVGDVDHGLVQERDERRVAALCRSALEHLGRGFPCHLGQQLQAVGVDRAQVPGVNTIGANVVELGDRDEYRLRGVGGGGLPKPCQRCAVAGLVNGEELIKAPAPLFSEKRRQMVVGCLLGLGTSGSDELLQAGDAGSHHLVAMEPFAGQLEEEGRFVVFKSALHEPQGQDL